MIANSMSPPRRYDPIAAMLHWFLAAAVTGQFALGWLMQAIAKSPPGPRAAAFNLHKSIGLAILLLMLLRIAWRANHAPPALPAMPAWQARAAWANHALLYALLVALPVVGYLGSAFSGYPVRFFGMALPAWTRHDEGLKSLMSALHLGAASLLAAAVALHLGAVARHALVLRDGILARMGLRLGKRAPVSPGEAAPARAR
jgi:cytochrome b561